MLKHEIKQKNNSGGLFPNRYKDRSDKSPDMTGKCMVEGKFYRLAAWNNHLPDGTPYLGLKFTTEEEYQEHAARLKGGTTPPVHREGLMDNLTSGALPEVAPEFKGLVREGSVAEIALSEDDSDDQIPF